MKITLWRLIIVIIAAIALWLMSGTRDQEEPSLSDEFPAEDVAPASPSDAPGSPSPAPEAAPGVAPAN